MSIAKAEALRSAEQNDDTIFSMAISGHFLSLYIVEGEVNDANRRTLLSRKIADKNASVAISGDFHIFIYIEDIEGNNERCESALSTMIDLKGENQKCHILAQHDQGVQVAFRKSGDSDKRGNSNGDSAAGHVRVLRVSDARRCRHRRVVVLE